MPDEVPALIRIAALCTMLVEALAELELQIAPEGLTADLRDLCARAHAELERNAKARG